ncbi:hypothetical protein V1478_016565 [Vespula squamosa]|uniref:Uncharacterized protein n=1 Tax=Vespula squamosa TaxID=30214 RepID=A0ABD2A081_VESSQ
MKPPLGTGKVVVRFVKGRQVLCCIKSPCLAVTKRASTTDSGRGTLKQSGSLNSVTGHTGYRGRNGTKGSSKQRGSLREYNPNLQVTPSELAQLQQDFRAVLNAIPTILSPCTLASFVHRRYPM